MNGSELSERKKQILKAVVEAHIAYGEPVGSKYLTQNAQFTCSSATIRNEMAELEALGYLEQPHTSAGRIPTEAGYRLYVDNLLVRYNMAQAEIEQIMQNLRRKTGELDQILAEASRLAGVFTNYPGLAARPKAPSVTVTRFETMYIDSVTFILVMLFSNGAVKTKRIRTSLTLDQVQLGLLSEALNDLMTGKTADNISLSDILLLEERMGEVAPVVNPLIKVIYETLNEFDDGELRVDGVNRLLQCPDYSDIGEVRELIHLFEQKDELLEVISSEGEQDDDVHVKIGSENAVDVMNNSSLVYRVIRSGGRVLGAIGVIGPCRMDYARVISIINNLALGIDHLISDGDDSQEKGPTCQNDQNSQKS